MSAQKKLAGNALLYSLASGCAFGVFHSMRRVFIVHLATLMYLPSIRQRLFFILFITGAWRVTLAAG
jgi:hypothetical protein